MLTTFVLSCLFSTVLAKAKHAPYYTSCIVAAKHNPFKCFPGIPGLEDRCVCTTAMCDGKVDCPCDNARDKNCPSNPPDEVNCDKKCQCPHGTPARGALCPDGEGQVSCSMCKRGYVLSPILPITDVPNAQLYKCIKPCEHYCGQQEKKNLVQCLKTGASCDLHDNARNCCENDGGIKKCSRNRPYLCQDGTCVNVPGHCFDPEFKRGPVRTIDGPANSTCPLLKQCKESDIVCPLGTTLATAPCYQNTGVCSRQECCVDPNAEKKKCSDTPNICTSKFAKISEFDDFKCMLTTTCEVDECCDHICDAEKCGNEPTYVLRAGWSDLRCQSACPHDKCCATVVTGFTTCEPGVCQGVWSLNSKMQGASCSKATVTGCTVDFCCHQEKTCANIFAGEPTSGESRIVPFPCDSHNMTPVEDFQTKACSVAGPGASCSAGICCKGEKTGTCASITCTNSVKKLIADGLVCNTGACTESDCCRPSCAPYLASVNGVCPFGKSKNKPDFICTKNGDQKPCSIDECCEDTCASFKGTCPVGSQRYTDTTKCENVPCSPSDCCDQNVATTCDKVECPWGRKKPLDLLPAKCSKVSVTDDEPNCAVEECCVDDCAFFTGKCDAGMEPTHPPPKCEGGPCSKWHCCCHETVHTCYSCKGVECRKPFIEKKAHLQPVKCIGFPCTTNQCCSYGGGIKSCLNTEGSDAGEWKQFDCEEHGMKPRDDICSRLCSDLNGNKEDKCTTAVCCADGDVGKCNKVSCINGKAEEASSIDCNGGPCSTNVCCRQVCTDYERCDSGRKITDADTKVCTGATCTLSECCVDDCTNAQVNCPAGQHEMDGGQCTNVPCLPSDCCQGSPCTNDKECKDTQKCKVSTLVDATDCAGEETCTCIDNTGAPCDDDKDCAEAYTCKVSQDAGAADCNGKDNCVCTGSPKTPCESKKDCSTTEVCKVSTVTGAKDCEEDDTGCICVPGTGIPCDETSDCASAHVCKESALKGAKDCDSSKENNNCVCVPGVGTPCKDDEQCGPDLVCKESNKPGAASCNDGSSCICVIPPPIPCNTQKDCLGDDQRCKVTSDPAAADCPVNGKNCVCTKVPPTTPCETDGDCKAGKKCKTSVATGSQDCKDDDDNCVCVTEPPTSCADDDDCAGTKICLQSNAKDAAKCAGNSSECLCVNPPPKTPCNSQDDCKNRSDSNTVCKTSDKPGGKLCTEEDSNCVCAPPDTPCTTDSDCKTTEKCKESGTKGAVDCTGNTCICVPNTGDPCASNSDCAKALTCKVSNEAGAEDCPQGSKISDGCVCVTGSTPPVSNLCKDTACPEPTKKKDFPPEKCEGKVCKMSECCTGHCATYTIDCPAGHEKISPPSACSNGDCSYNDCCFRTGANHACDTVECPGGWQKKAGSELPALCTDVQCLNKQCCELTPVLTCESFTNVQCPTDSTRKVLTTPCVYDPCRKSDCCTGQTLQCTEFPCRQHLPKKLDVTVCNNEPCNEEDCCGVSQLCSSFTEKCPITAKPPSTSCKDYPCSYNDCCEGGDGENTCYRFESKTCKHGMVPKISKLCTDFPCSIYDCCNNEVRPRICSKFPCSGGDPKSAPPQSCVDDKCTEKQCCDAECSFFTINKLTTCKFADTPKKPPPSCSASEVQRCDFGQCCEKQAYSSCDLVQEHIGCPGNVPLADYAEDCVENCTTTTCCKPDVCLNIQEACPIGFKRPDTYICPEIPCTPEQCCVINTGTALTCQAVANDADCVDEAKKDSTRVKDLSQTGLCGTMEECRIQCCKGSSDSGKKAGLGSTEEAGDSNALLIALIVAAVLLLLCCLCIPLAYKQYKKNQAGFKEDALHGPSSSGVSANYEAKTALHNSARKEKTSSPRARPVPRGSSENISSMRASQTSVQRSGPQSADREQQRRISRDSASRDDGSPLSPGSRSGVQMERSLSRTSATKGDRSPSGSPASRSGIHKRRVSKGSESKGDSSSAVLSGVTKSYASKQSAQGSGANRSSMVSDKIDASKRGGRRMTGTSDQGQGQTSRQNSRKQ